MPVSIDSFAIAKYSSRPVFRAIGLECRYAFSPTSLLQLRRLDTVWNGDVFVGKFDGLWSGSDNCDG